MKDVKAGKSDTPGRDVGGLTGAGWPPWARRAASAVLVFHIAAVVAGALAAQPSSPIERAAADLFGAYHQAVDQGYGYRYYAPEPGPTPVVTATVTYADGRPEETVRLPTRGVWPRLRYQRQLALANHLVADFEEARRATGDGARSAYARSYARHIAKGRPGCATVTLYAQSHLIPDPRQVRELLAAGRPVDIDAEEYYSAPERIGEFPCDAF
jgi:hypothetical protein